MKHEKPRRPVNEVVFEGLQRDRSSYRREDLSRAILLLRFYNGIWGSLNRSDWSST